MKTLEKFVDKSNIWLVKSRNLSLKYMISGHMLLFPIPVALLPYFHNKGAGQTVWNVKKEEAQEKKLLKWADRVKYLLGTLCW